MMKKIYLKLYNFLTYKFHYAITFTFVYLNILYWNLKKYTPQQDQRTENTLEKYQQKKQI